MFLEALEKTVHMEGAGDRIRHPLDYILVKHRFRNSVKDVETLPGTDIISNLNLLDLYQIEGNCKVPKEKTTMRFVEIIYSTTKSSGYPRRETWGNWI
jgi:hypothetical protein